MLENNKIFYFFIFLCLQNTWSTNVQFFTHNSDNDPEATIIYRIKNITNFDSSHNVGFMDLNFLSTYKENYTIEINSNTNYIIPFQFTDARFLEKLFIDRLFRDIMNLSYNSSDWISGKFKKINGNYCNFVDEYYAYTTTTRYYEEHTTLITDPENDVNQCYSAFEFSNSIISTFNYYDNINDYNMISFDWTPTEEMSCLSITYRLVNFNQNFYYGSKYTVTVRITDDYDNLINSTELEKGNDIKTVKFTDMALVTGQKYKFALNLNWNRDFRNSYPSSANNKLFGLYQIVSYSEYDEKFTQIVSFQEFENNRDLSHPNRDNIFGKDSTFDGNGKSTESNCLNGGYETKKKPHCICPPGFKGNACETGCGPNLYGPDCERVCSIYHGKMCRGSMICTVYGCECPPGLTGPLCNQDCAPGTYGAGCKQNCSSHCYNHKCNQYTGICNNGCEQGYVLPFCQERYSYVMSSPELVSSQYESLELKLNFNLENIKGTSKMIKYYQLLYKTLDEEQYKTSELILLLNNTITSAVISNLEPDTTYKVGVLIIADDGNFNDKDIVYGQYNTSCIQPQISDYNVKLVSGVNSINITWNKVQTQRLECAVTEYVLTLTSTKSESLEILSSSDRGHIINDLLPGIKYKIKLTPKTNKESLISSPLYSFYPLMTANDVEISNLSTEMSNGKIKVFWKFTNSFSDAEIINVPITCIVKYKLSRVFSCSLKEIENDWTTLTIFNRTSYEIFNAVSNAQYIIKLSVLVSDIDTVQSENIVYALTPSSSPKTEPILDTEHPMYITNNSVSVGWKNDPMACSKLNGIFSKFYIELLGKSENILQAKETDQNYIQFDDLKSNSDYEMKIFIKTHFGHNPEKFLIINFKTKSENLKPIEDIMVYKKSLKERMVGLRWSYSQNSKVDGFMVSFNNDAFTNSSSISVIQPEKCSAWPEYYCHTFYNLTHSKTHTFKIKPTSVDYPEGGKVSSISFSIIDGLPESPTNIITPEIGHTTIQLQWDIPWIFNGALKKFIIYVEEISSLDISTCCANIRQIDTPIDEELPNYNYTIPDLQPGSTYMIGVVTVSKSSWYSSPAKILATTLVDE